MQNEFCNVVRSSEFHLPWASLIFVLKDSKSLYTFLQRCLCWRRISFSFSCSSACKRTDSATWGMEKYEVDIFLELILQYLKNFVHGVHKRLIHTLSLIIVCSKSLSMSAASLCNWMASSTLPFLDAFSACRCNKWALFSIIEGNLTSMPAFTCIQRGCLWKEIAP